MENNHVDWRSYAGGHKVWDSEDEVMLPVMKKSKEPLSWINAAGILHELVDVWSEKLIFSYTLRAKNNRNLKTSIQSM